MFLKRNNIQAKIETAEPESYCGYCGARLPYLTEGEFGSCPDCRRRFGESQGRFVGERQGQFGGSQAAPGNGTARRVKPEQVRFSYGPGYCNFNYTAPGPVYRDPILAAVLSIIIPGGGQVYNHHFIKGILIFATSFLIVPYILGILDAYICARSINRRRTEEAARRREYSGHGDFSGRECCAEPSY